MSSDEDESGGRKTGHTDGPENMAFTDENDFVDGKWINGEYYAREKIEGRHQSKEDSLYGVFGEGSSDEDTRQRNRKRERKLGRNRGDLTKPVNFVGGKLQEGDEPVNEGDEEKGAREKKGRAKVKWEDQKEDELVDTKKEKGEEEEEEDDEIVSADLESRRKFLELLKSAETPNDLEADLSSGGNTREEKGYEGDEEQDEGGWRVAKDEEDEGEDYDERPGLGRQRRREETEEEDEVKPKSKAPMQMGNADFRAFLMRGLASVEKVKQEEEEEEDEGKVAEDARKAQEQEEEKAKAAEKEKEKKKELNEAKAMSKKPPVKMDSSFGKWEKHTKGFGAKMLAKMGFTGRLGKEESGVTRQLEVKVRPDRMGLGHGNFKEATTLKSNRKLEADRQGKTLEELERSMGIEPKKRTKKDDILSTAEKEASKGLWRKGRQEKRQKRRYMTAEELLREQQGVMASSSQFTAPPRQVIIDMRGPQAKLLSALEDISYGEDHVDSDGDVVMDMETEGDATAIDAAVMAKFKPKLGQELLHNCSLLVDMAERELHQQSTRKRVAQDQLVSLRRDVSDLQSRVGTNNSRLERIQQVGTLLDRVVNKIASDPLAVSSDAVLRLFATLRREFPEEFTVFGLAQLAPAIAAPIMKRSLAKWDPLAHPLQVVELLGTWSPVLTEVTTVVGRGDTDDKRHKSYGSNGSALSSGGGGGYYGNGQQLHNEVPLEGIQERSLAAKREGEVAFEMLTEEVVIPRIRSALMNDTWDVYDPRQATRLIGALSKVAPKRYVDALLEQTILPKLTRGVAQWRPASFTAPPATSTASSINIPPATPSRTTTIPSVSSVASTTADASASDDGPPLAGVVVDTAEQGPTPLDLWVIPWLPILGSQRVQLLLPEIRRKLAAALTHWKPGNSLPRQHDEAALALMKPWVGIFDQRSFDALLVKTIVPKLLTCLRETLVINPAAQDVIPFQAVLEWQSVVPQMHMLALIEGEFFPKWLRTLHVWLSNGGANLSEVAQWYQGWKSLLPQPLLSKPAIEAQFNLALGMMQATMVAGGKSGMIPLPLSASDKGGGATYQTVLERYKAEAQVERQLQLDKQIQQRDRVQSAKSASAAAAAASHHRVSFKELVEDFATEHSLTMMPKPGHRHQGKQVYAFGKKVNVFLDSEVVYAELTKGSGSWVPISLDNLLTHVKKLSGGSGSSSSGGGSTPYNKGGVKNSSSSSRSNTGGPPTSSSQQKPRRGFSDSGIDHGLD